MARPCFKLEKVHPDPVAGVTLSRQDRWLQQAAYVAWRDS